jgi:hypothetical protein
MDDRDLETVPDDESSLASWETCSELESEQSMIDEDHFSGHYLDHGLDQLYFNGNVAVQDDESSSATWGTYSKSFSEQVEDDSFDQVLDVLSSAATYQYQSVASTARYWSTNFQTLGEEKDTLVSHITHLSPMHSTGPSSSGRVGGSWMRSMLHISLLGFEDF